MLLHALLSLGVYTSSVTYLGQTKEITYMKSLLNYLSVVVLSMFVELPTMDTFTPYMMFVWVILADIIFTITHRALHTRYLYHLHKEHHMHHSPKAADTFDANPLEFIFGNVATAVLPMLLFPADVYTQYIWIGVATLNTILSHHHDGPHTMHHRLLKYNYGQGLYLFDRLCGTYTPFVAS